MESIETIEYLNGTPISRIQGVCSIHTEVEGEWVNGVRAGEVELHGLVEDTREPLDGVGRVQSTSKRNVGFQAGFPNALAWVDGPSLRLSGSTTTLAFYHD